mgnify:CR=1 FL=1|jgi:hypothetical protein
MNHVIDTNVLIVASGEHPDSPFLSADHPVDKPEIADKVLQWLSDFIDSNQLLVVDTDDAIRKEYFNKLSEQNYGRRAYIDKYDKGQIEYMALTWEVKEPDWTAELSDKLKVVVHDRSDKKFVAACIESLKENDTNIINACDTDWIDWEDALAKEGIVVEQLINDWVREKWNTK